MTNTTTKAAPPVLPVEPVYEKRSSHIHVCCTPNEKRRWIHKWGRFEVSRKVRELLNQASSQ